MNEIQTKRFIEIEILERDANRDRDEHLRRVAAAKAEYERIKLINARAAVWGALI